MKVFQKESVGELEIEMIFLLIQIRWSSSQSKTGSLVIRGVRDRNNPNRVETPFRAFGPMKH